MHNFNSSLLTSPDFRCPLFRCCVYYDFCYSNPLFLKIQFQINDFSDLNGGEKSFLKLWNEHLTTSPCFGDRHVYITLQNFIDKFAQVIFEQNLYRNFILHVTNLSEFGVLSRPAVFLSITRLQQAFKNITKQNGRAVEQRQQKMTDNFNQNLKARQIENITPANALQNRKKTSDNFKTKARQIVNPEDNVDGLSEIFSSEENFCLHLSDDEDDVTGGSEETSTLGYNSSTITTSSNFGDNEETSTSSSNSSTITTSSSQRSTTSSGHSYSSMSSGDKRHRKNNNEISPAILESSKYVSRCYIKCSKYLEAKLLTTKMGKF